MKAIKLVQVREYVVDITDCNIRHAFCVAMAKWNKSTVYSVQNAFYDIDVLNTIYEDVKNV